MSSLIKRLKTNKALRFILLKLRYLNLFKTLYINLRMLPLRQAVRFPIMVFGRASFISLRGKITIDAPEIRPGMIRLGYPDDMFSNLRNVGVINLDGELIFKGRFDSAPGYYFRTYSGGKLVFGRNIKIGSSIWFASTREITIGDYTRMAFGTAIMDSAFHFTVDRNSNMVSAIDGRVKIGAYNWIANRCTIQKGTVTPDDLVIASGSLLNKDYTVAIPPYSMIGGRPAKLLRENLARVWNPHAEEALRKAFGATGESRLEFIDLKLK